uniref:Smr domain-containing protein n=1 Tax=Angiostrongylus cantonensis TaxID=6313 RepID=A0A0K0DPQ3_ANGCA
LLQKISLLFGEGIIVEEECSVRLPLWLLKQLYLFWQNSGTSFPSNREALNDAEIAAALQEEEDAIASASFKASIPAREHSLREKNLRKQAGDIIIKANEDSTVLDLHLLSQKDAIMLLKERLSALDRPVSMRHGRSSQRLHVITGYGRSTGGRSVIKPAVEFYLKRKGYIYSFANMGEVVVQCK